MRSLGRIQILILLLFLSTTQAYSLRFGPGNSLLISPSPSANGMGLCYGALLTDEPMAAIFNPAAVGLFVQDKRFGLLFYTKDANWPTRGYTEWPYNAWIVNYGFDGFRASKIPRGIGIAYHSYYHRVKHLKYGPDYINTRLFAERTNGLSLSAGVDVGIKMSLGYTIKYFESEFGLFENAKNRIGSSALAHDFGLVFELPLFATIFDSSNTPHQNVSPFLTSIFHISRRNVGSKLKYKDAAHRDPLPRQVYTGLAIKAGLAYNSDTPFDIFHIHWAREVDDILLRYTADGRYSYSSFSRDIDFMENVVLGESNEQIAVHQGYEIGLADVLFLRGGRYDYLYGDYALDTHGYGVNFTQAVKLIAVLFQQDKSNRLIKMLRLIDIEYHASSWDATGEDAFDNLKFNSVTISFKRL